MASAGVARFNAYMLKTIRITAWPLLALVSMYILTGYVLCGKYGFERLVDPNTILPIHRMFDTVLVVVLLSHALPAIYLAMWRWRWIRR